MVSMEGDGRQKMGEQKRKGTKGFPPISNLIGMNLAGALITARRYRPVSLPCSRSL